MIIKSPDRQGSLFKIINLITPTNINFPSRYLSLDILFEFIFC